MSRDVCGGVRSTTGARGRELPGPTGEDAVDVLDGDVVLRPEALLHGDAELIGLRAQPKGALRAPGHLAGSAP